MDRCTYFIERKIPGTKKSLPLVHRGYLIIFLGSDKVTLLDASPTVSTLLCSAQECLSSCTMPLMG